MDSSERWPLLKYYAEAVSKAPSYLGLTSSADRDQFFARHVEDAIIFSSVIPLVLKEGAISVIDVGSGNGVPGIIWAVLFPHWEVTLLDSDSKKCGFLESFCISYAIRNVSVKALRAEIYAHSEMRQTFDLSVSRAIGSLSTTLELTSAFSKIGGYNIVSRGTSPNNDLELAASIIELLGFASSEQALYKVNRYNYAALILKKIKNTPTDYPRAVGKPAKRPL